MENSIQISEEYLVTIARFISKVSAMRSAQRNYFRERTYSYLTQSKALEKEIDNMIIEATEASNKIYKSLFNN